MWRSSAAILAFLALITPKAHADTVADFYKGKLVRVVVGFGSGGGYDVYARLLSRHFGRHIPGNPSVVVQNMPGAGRATCRCLPLWAQMRASSSIRAALPGSDRRQALPTTPMC